MKMEKIVMTILVLILSFSIIGIANASNSANSEQSSNSIVIPIGEIDLLPNPDGSEGGIGSDGSNEFDDRAPLPYCKSAPVDLHYKLAVRYMEANYPGLFTVDRKSATQVGPCNKGNTAWTKFNALGKPGVSFEYGGTVIVNGDTNEVTFIHATEVVRRDRYEIITGRTIYSVNDNNGIKIDLWNSGEKSVTLTTSNNCRKFFKITDLSNNRDIALYNKNNVCAQAAPQLTINPGEIKTIGYWDKIDYDNSNCKLESTKCEAKYVHPGKYKISAGDASKVIYLIAEIKEPSIELIKDDNAIPSTDSSINPNKKTEETTNSQNVKLVLIKNSESIIEKSDILIQDKKDLSRIKMNVKSSCTDSNNNECEKYKLDLKNSAKPHLSVNVDLMEEKLQNVKLKVESSSMENKDVVLGRINTRLQKIAEVKPVIGSISETTSNSEIKEIALTLKNEWDATKKEIKIDTYSIFNTKLGYVIEKSESLGKELDDMTVKLDEKGYDTSYLKTEITEFKKNIELSREKYVIAQESLDKTKKSGKEEAYKKLLAETYPDIAESYSKIKDARLNLKNIVTTLKQDSEGEKALESITKEEQNKIIYIGWEETLNILRSGQVTGVTQTHSLDVTLKLENGKSVLTREPYIDAIFKEIDNCRNTTCSAITSLATE